MAVREACGALLKYLLARHPAVGIPKVSDPVLGAELVSIDAARTDAASDVSHISLLNAQLTLSSLAPPFPAPTSPFPTLQQLAFRACEDAWEDVPAHLQGAATPTFCSKTEARVFSLFDREVHFVRWLSTCHDTGVVAPLESLSFPLYLGEKLVSLCRSDFKSGALAAIAVFAPCFLDEFFPLVEKRGVARTLALRCFAVCDNSERSFDVWNDDERECLLPRFWHRIPANLLEPDMVAAFGALIRFGHLDALRFMVSCPDFAFFPGLTTWCTRDCNGPLLVSQDGSFSAQERELQSRKLALLVEKYPEAVCNYRSDAECTLLHMTAQYGDASRARMLLECGVDPTVQNKAGKRAVELVALHADEWQRSLLMEVMPGDDEEKAELIRLIPMTWDLMILSLSFLCALSFAAVGMGRVPLVFGLLVSLAFLCLLSYLAFYYCKKETGKRIDRRLLNVLCHLFELRFVFYLLCKPFVCTFIFALVSVVSLFLDTVSAGKMFLVLDIVCLHCALHRGDVYSRSMYLAGSLVVFVAFQFLLVVFVVQPLVAPFYFGFVTLFAVFKCLLFHATFSFIGGQAFAWMQRGVFELRFWKDAVRHWGRTYCGIVVASALLALLDSSFNTASLFCTLLQMLHCASQLALFQGGLVRKYKTGHEDWEAWPLGFVCSSMVFCLVVVESGDRRRTQWRQMPVGLSAAALSANVLTLLLSVWRASFIWPAPLRQRNPAQGTGMFDW
jgi:hypothetical protein